MWSQLGAETADSVFAGVTIVGERIAGMEGTEMVH
jgi:hypothetical protein